MIKTSLTKRSIVSLLVTATFAVSSAYASELSHILASPFNDEESKQELQNVSIDVSFFIWLVEWIYVYFKLYFPHCIVEVKISDFPPLHILTRQVARALKSKSSKKKTLETTFKRGFHDDYDDMRGWVKVNFSGKKMDIDYSVSDGPESCEDCYIAILDENDCDDADDSKTLYKSTSWEDEDPWKKGGKTQVTTTSKGNASGGISGVKSGFSYGDTHCKVVVIRGPSAKKKYSKSNKRMLKSKADSGDGTDVLLCGVLHKKGKRNDC